jgi:hypothetical protein
MGQFSKLDHAPGDRYKYVQGRQIKLRSEPDRGWRQMNGNSSCLDSTTLCVGDFDGLTCRVVTHARHQMNIHVLPHMSWVTWKLMSELYLFGTLLKLMSMLDWKWKSQYYFFSFLSCKTSMYSSLTHTQENEIQKTIVLIKL